MQQALDAMLNFPNDISDEMFESIRSLRARLATPDTAAVGEVGVWGERKWAGLTDDEIKQLRHLIDETAGWSYVTFARAVETRLKEKNHG